MKWLAGLLIGVLLLLSGPMLMLASDTVRMDQPWYAADRSSAGLAPDPQITRDAVVQIYSARAFSWRGLFAVHTWIATKPAGAPNYTVHQVTGWGFPALRSGIDVPDRRWVGALPELLLDLRGEVAARAINHIEQALKVYPFAVGYRVWPGPNSNTFTAWMIRHVPELQVAMPSNAIGKDYLAGGVFAPAPSGSGYQLSLFGVLGVMLARDEGIEFNTLGLVWGLDVTPFAVKWPGVGRIGLPEDRRGSEPMR